MALTDSLEKAYNLLIDGYHECLNEGYLIDEWDIYINKIFELSYLMSKIDDPITTLDGKVINKLNITKLKPVGRYYYARVDENIIEQLLAGRKSSQPKRESLLILSEVARSNKILRNAIVSVYEWRQSEEGIAEFIKYADDTFVSIDELYNMVTRA